MEPECHRSDISLVGQKPSWLRTEPPTLTQPRTFRCFEDPSRSEAAYNSPATSVLGTNAKCRLRRAMSELEGEAEDIYSYGVLLT